MLFYAHPSATHHSSHSTCTRSDTPAEKMHALQKSLLALYLITSIMAQPTGINSALQAITQGAHVFSSNFVKTVAKEETGNLICSPLSANIALSMAADGSAGNTELEFKNVLNLPSSKQETLTGYQNLIETLNNVENVTLKIANKMFVGTKFPVKPEYKQQLRTYYYSDIQTVNFAQNAQAAEIINNWCKEKTNDRIKSIVTERDLDPSTALVLANAVYFKGNWQHQFDSKATIDRPFHVDSNTVKQVPTMYRKGDYKFANLPEYNAKCIELPYANKDVSMVIILPNEINGLATLTDKLDEVTAECNRLLSQTYEQEVRLYLPKFKTESKLNLGDTLSDKMGLVEPFSNRADFSGISNVPLKISKVVQKAFIEVNEEGSEAAAVTGMAVVAMSLSFDEKILIDHPFYYAIVKNNLNPESEGQGTVTLFSGIVTKPEI